MAALVETARSWVQFLFPCQDAVQYKVVKVISVTAGFIVVVDVVRRIINVWRLHKSLAKCPTMPGFSWISGSMSGIPPYLSWTETLGFSESVAKTSVLEHFLVMEARTTFVLVLQIPKDPEERLVHEVAMVTMFPKCYLMWFGPCIPILKVHHPETMKIILKSSEPKNTYTGGYKHLKPWLGEGLLIANGSRWARSRRLLTPAFHFDILKPYMPVFNQCSDTLLTKIDKYAKTGESFDIFNLVTHCTLDIILQCAMSYDSKVQDHGDTHPYLNAVKEMLATSNMRIMKPYLNPDIIFYNSSHSKKFLENCNYVHTIAEYIIETRKKTLEQGGFPNKKRLDFLDVLLSAKDEHGVGLTALEIRNEVDTFLFEGHDTTASAISWMLYSMAEHPEIQSRVQTELDDVTGDKPEVTWDNLQNLEYFTRCVKEGLRYHSPVPFVARRLAQDMVFDGMVFPANTVVLINIFGLHHNPEVWSKPEVFDPDRFLTDNIIKMDQYAYVPFAAGPRNCIGQHFAMNEDKVVAARVLKKYRLEVDPTHDAKRVAKAIMKSQSGLWVRAIPRH